VVFKESPHQAVTAGVPADPGEVARARELVRTALRAWDLQDHEAVLELAASELVTNALTHGRGDVEVAIGHHDGLLRLEVTDGGGGVPTPRAPSDAGLGGWGLRIVDQVADAWGADADDGGRTTVWMVRGTP
jgi:anti-sigma regulatory factor (Ser/Thr protein kinase)